VEVRPVVNVVAVVRAGGLFDRADIDESEAANRSREGPIATGIIDGPHAGAAAEAARGIDETAKNEVGWFLVIGGQRRFGIFAFHGLVGAERHLRRGDYGEEGAESCRSECRPAYDHGYP